MKRKYSKSDYNQNLHEEINDSRAVSLLYDKYRADFVSIVRNKFSLNREQAVELYQDCFVTLYENVKSGKLTVLSCSLKTYLLSIARNKMYNTWRDAKPVIEEFPENIAEQDEEWSRQQEIAYDVVQQLAEPCNTVLTLYYWEEYSMSEIARVMNYSGAQVAQNRKLKCMRKLKSLLHEQFDIEGLL